MDAFAHRGVLNTSMAKRLVSRRGSTSAPDPFNAHPDPTGSSTLTIVRVIDEDEPVNRKFHRSDTPSNRLSFAFSSFGGRPSSPTSPSSSPRLTSHFKPRLSPDQIVDLAKQSTSPSNRTTTAAFTPLPDDVYLPFIERPSEVAAVISSPPDLKLFTLLAHTFPPPTTDGDLPRDPTKWSYSHLIHHLTRIDRDVAPDFLWAIAARKCIMSHSELIWERVKGALGIPPELDVDYDFLEDEQPSPEGSETGDDSAFLDPLMFASPMAMVASPIGGDETLPFPQEEQNIDHISIEPLVTSPPPSTGEGLGDIAEGEEEEAESEATNQPPTQPPPPSSLFDSISPAQIQGLRISTSPLSSTTNPVAPTQANIKPPHATHSRTSSASSLLGPFNRSESTGGLAALWAASTQSGVFFSGGSEAGDSSVSSIHEEHLPGMGPKFPGNFARLGLAAKGGGGRRYSSSSITSSTGKKPHARYIASEGKDSPATASAFRPSSPNTRPIPKDKVRAFSHAGGQRPMISGFVPQLHAQPKPRRSSSGSGAGAQAGARAGAGTGAGH